MQKNRIELAGYLGGKVTVRYLPSGTPVANVRMAEGYRYMVRTPWLLARLSIVERSPLSSLSSRVSGCR